MMKESRTEPLAGPQEASWPVGGTTMAARIRAHDWAATPLGPFETWPPSLRTAIDICLASGFASFVWWGRDLIQFYNDAALAILRSKHPASFAAPARRAWSDVWDVVEPLVARVISTGRPVVGEDMPVVPDRGGPRETATLTFSYSVLRDESGSIAGMFITAIETTAKVRAETALREGEARLRGFVENSADVLWIVDTEARRLEYLSPAYEAIWGEPRERIMRDLGRWVELVHPADRARASRNLPQALAGATVSVEYRIVRPSDGAVRWIRDTGFPIPSADGRIRRVGGIAQDITEEKAAGERLRELNEALEARVAARTAELQQALSTLHDEVLERQQAEERLRQSEKLKAVGQLTGGIAHDLNNMLQAITSGLSMIRTRLRQGRSGDVLSYVERAERGTMRAAALTQRLLAFGRQQTLTPKPVSLDQIARGMEEMIRRTVGPSVQVELKLADGNWLVMCDPNQMESALLNLCVNARDAMPEGGWLTVSTEQLVLSEAHVANQEDAKPGRYAAIAVTDTGTGMSPELLAHVFEPFFTTKPLGQGTGLGLSQIYGFVRQSGGIVQIETAFGVGTTVRLCLPFHAQNPDIEAIPALETGKTVLLVEDEPDVRELLAEQLRGQGYRVLEADTGPAALRLIRAGARIDLLISDYGLPGGMNGRQVIEAAHERHPSLPAIVITGFAGGEALAGMEVIRKPFEPAVLMNQVEGKLGLANSSPR